MTRRLGASLLPLAAALVVAAVYILPLTCKPVSLDEYGRVIKVPDGNIVMQIICMPTEHQEWARAQVVQAIIVMFTFLTTLCAREMAADAFYALSTRYGGLSISFAELLLSLPAPATERTNTQRMQDARANESKKHSMLKWGLLAMFTAVLPLLSGGLTPIAAGTYSAQTVRFPQVSILTSSIPSWISLENLRRYGWIERLDSRDLSNRKYVPGWSLFESPWADYGKYYTESPYFGKKQVTPSGYTYDTMHYFTTGDTNVQPGMASGLQTVYMSVPQATKPRTLGVIPLTNVLYDPVGYAGSRPNDAREGSSVPSNTTDLVVLQTMLVFDQRCSLFLSNNGDNSLIRQGKWTFEKLNYTRSTFSEAEVARFADMILTNTSWRRMQPTTGYGRSQRKHDISVGLVQVFYNYTWQKKADGKEESLVVYAAMPRVFVGPAETKETTGLMCRTEIFPVALNASIPAGLVAVRAVGSNYTRTPFTRESRQLLSTALQLTERAVDQMGNKTYPTEPLLTDYFPGCDSNAVHEDLWPRPVLGGLALFPTLNYTQDSCVSTDFDRLLKAHLTFLSFLPTDTPSSTWLWGPSEIRYLPNKLYCALMAGLTGTLFICLLVLRVVTWPKGQAEYAADFTSPWAGLLARHMKHCNNTTHEYMVKLDPSSPDLMVLHPLGAEASPVLAPLGPTSGTGHVHVSMAAGAVDARRPPYDRVNDQAMPVLWQQK